MTAPEKVLEVKPWIFWGGFINMPGSTRVRPLKQSRKPRFKTSTSLSLSLSLVRTEKEVLSSERMLERSDPFRSDGRPKFIARKTHASSPSITPFGNLSLWRLSLRQLFLLVPLFHFLQRNMCPKISKEHKTGNQFQQHCWRWCLLDWIVLFKRILFFSLLFWSYRFYVLFETFF